MCFFCTDDSQKLGIFLKRDNYFYSRMKDLRFELQMQFFETGIVSEAIEAFFIHQYKKFDALVGDCKCQVRVSMLLDIVQKNTLNSSNLKKTEEDMNELQERLLSFIEKTEAHQMTEIKKIVNLIKNMQIYDFFQKHKLNYILPCDIWIITIFFLAFLKTDQIIQSSNNFINKSKAEDILKFIKKKLSEITIEYEKKLAKEYGYTEIEKILEVIEKKGVSSMTAFYPSFVPVWEKIKDKKQLVLKKTIYICLCGGIKDIKGELFRANENNKLEIIEVRDLNEAAFVIEGYQFSGSFEELSEKINLSIRNSIFDASDLKLCTCQKSLNVPVIENIDEAVLANFAQHTQFTNGAEIDWIGLGLGNSELKKEYDRLRTLPGYGINDMSKFCIVHIYASTVEQEFEDQRQLLTKLGKK